DETTRGARRPMNQRLTPVALGVLSFAGIAAAWELAVRGGWLNPFFTSQPTAIAAALARSAQAGGLWPRILITLGEVAAGVGAAIVVGFAVGVAAGRSRSIEYALDPFVWFIYSAPLIAFYPLFVLWLGLGTRTVIAISFLLSVTPIAVNTTSGIRQINPSLVL